MTTTKPICWFCGYDLSGQPDLATDMPRCPECGANDAIVGPRKPVYPPEPPSRFLVERSVLSCIFTFVGAELAAFDAPVTLCLSLFGCALLVSRRALVLCTRRERLALLALHLLLAFAMSAYFIMNTAPKRGM